MDLTADGEVNDFDYTKKIQIGDKVAAGIAGVTSRDVKLSVAAASVIITLVINVPSGVTVTAVRDGLVSTLGTPAAATSVLSSLGIKVTFVTSPISSLETASPPPPPAVATDDSGGGGGAIIAVAVVVPLIIVILLLVYFWMKKGSGNAPDKVSGMPKESSSRRC
jgi:hypothetical protein